MALQTTIFVLSCSCISWLVATARAQTWDEREYVTNHPYVAANQNDATLNAVSAFDEDRVIAVGDRGLILITNSAGRRWKKVLSSTTVNLYDVVVTKAKAAATMQARAGQTNYPRGLPRESGTSAADGQLGNDICVVVGGWIGSYSKASHAMVLRSLDGGESWEQVETLGLPRLTGVKSVGSRLVAWGDYSPRWSTSAFESRDQGVTWQPLNAPGSHADALEVSPNNRLLLIDCLGRGYFGQAGTDLNPVAISKPGRPLSFIQRTQQGWLAGGAAGDFVYSPDARGWNTVSLPISSEARRHCHWSVLAQAEDELWLAGSPGSVFFHSHDGGTTWEKVLTGNRLPINDLHFYDRNRGWAVGPLGLVLATRDGGKSWYPQRQTQKRLGLLSVADTHATTPWPSLVAASWEDRVACRAVVCEGDTAIEQADFLPPPSRTYATAAPQCGLVQASTWPRDYTVEQQSIHEPSGSRLISGATVSSDPAAVSSGTSLNRQSRPASATGSGARSAGNSSGAVADRRLRIARRLAIEVLCWRPSVILTDHANSDLALAALQLAEDTGRLLPVALELGINEWSVEKMVSVSEDDRAQYVESCQRILRGPGLSIWDLLKLLPMDNRSPDGRVAMRTRFSKLQNQAVNTSLMGGITPMPEMERSSVAEDLGNYQLIMGRAHLEKSLRKTLFESRGLTSLDKREQQLRFLLQSVPIAELDDTLSRLITHCDAPEQFEYRNMLVQLLERKRPKSDAAMWAGHQRLLLNTSEEIRAWTETSLPQGVRPLNPSPTPGLGNRPDANPSGSPDSNRQASPTDKGSTANPVVATAAYSPVRNAAWQASPFEAEMVRSSSSDAKLAGEPESAVQLASSTVPMDRSESNRDHPSAVSAAAIPGATLPGASGNIGRINGVNNQSNDSDAASPQPIKQSVGDDTMLKWLNLATEQFPDLLFRPDFILLRSRALARRFGQTAGGARLANSSALQPLQQLASNRQLIGWPQMAIQEQLLAANRVQGLKWVGLAAPAGSPPQLDGRLNDLCWSEAPPIHFEGLGPDTKSRTWMRWSYDDRYLYVAISVPKHPEHANPPVQRRRSYDSDLSELDRVEWILDTDRDYAIGSRFAVAQNGLTTDSCGEFTTFNPRWHVAVHQGSGVWQAEIAIDWRQLSTAERLDGLAWGLVARRQVGDQATESWSQLRSHQLEMQGAGLLLFLPEQQ